MSETLLGSGEGSAPQGGQEGGQGEQTGQDAGQQQQGQQQQGSQGGQSEWHAKFEGDDLGWLQNRGLVGKPAEEALANLVKGFRAAESRLGVPSDRLLKLPADRKAEGAMADVYKALGMPDDPKEYGFTAEDGDELAASFNDTVSKAFHGAGLNKEQAEIVYSAVEQFIENTAKTDLETAQENRAAEMEALKAEWGGEDNFRMNVLLAKEAVKALGATKEEIDALEAAFGEDGSSQVIKFFNRIGQKRGAEDKFFDGGSAFEGLGAFTPEAARAKMQEMKADEQFRKEMLHVENGGAASAAVNRYRKLAALASKGR